MENKKYETLDTGYGEYQTTLNRAFLNRKKWNPSDPGHVFSFMPGTVGRIYVKAGDCVREGENLMVFRAMKMDNNILSPVSGRIKSINVGTGDNLPKNALMIEIETK